MYKKVFLGLLIIFCFIYFFPKFTDLINDIVDANEATHALTKSAANTYPFREGIEALRKTYGAYCWEPDYFTEMERVVKDYALIAAQYFHENNKF